MNKNPNPITTNHNGLESPPRTAHPVDTILDLFIRIIPGLSSGHDLPKDANDRCWNPKVTLWAMISAFLLHRVVPASLMETLSHMKSGAADRLSSPGKTISALLENTVSTSALSQARSRLPEEDMRAVMTGQALAISDLADGYDWRGFRVPVLDGTICSLANIGDVSSEFSPSSNRHGTSHWCQMRVLGCFCPGTGLMLDCVANDQSVSEQAQPVQLMLKSKGRFGSAPLLWMGDRNFGVRRLAAAAAQSGGDILVSLSNSRATKLLGGKPVEGMDKEVVWNPSRHDQADEGLVREGVKGRVIVKRIEIRGFRPWTLVAFTTLTDTVTFTAEDIARLYPKRWNIELGFRQIKRQTGLEHMPAVKSGGMARRQLYAAMMAHNLVRGVMLLSSAVHGVPLERMSFAAAAASLGTFVRMLAAGKSDANLKDLMESVLYLLSKQLVPNRRKPRPHEPRQKRYRPEPYPPLRGSRQKAREKLLAELDQVA